MEEFEFHQVDVFTSGPLLGNPLAVVAGADILTDAQMAAFARWTNLSETAFLTRPLLAGADYRIRIFTPHQELAFAGHPTLGSCHAWLAAGGEPKGEEIVQECGIGLVRIRLAPGLLFFAAPPMVRSGPLDPDLLAKVIEGLRLPSDAFVAANWVDNGPGWLAVLLRSRTDVLAVRPDYALLSGLRVGVIGPSDTPGDDPVADFEVRAFTAAGFEDAATGSLNAGLARWLMNVGVAASSYVVSQGTAIGRAARLHVECERGEIWVGGAVSTRITGRLAL